MNTIMDNNEPMSTMKTKNREGGSAFNLIVNLSLLF
jgi:hypothetical protein